MRERAAVALGLLIAATAFLIVISQSRPHLAATNSNAVESKRSFAIRAGRHRCQSRQFVPRGAAAARLFVDTGRKAGGPLAVAIRSPGGELRAGSIAGGYRSGLVDVPISRPRRDAEGAEICVYNRGNTALRFAGSASKKGIPVDTGGRLSDVIRVDFMRPGRESWWTLAPTVARRFGFFKASLIGPSTIWVALGVLAAIWAATIALILRQVR